MTSQNLIKKYQAFTKIPLIIALIQLALSLISCAALAIAFYSFIFFILTAAVSAGFAFLTYYILSVIISPLVILTDSLLTEEYRNSNSTAAYKTSPVNNAPSVSPAERNLKRWLCKNCGAFNDFSSENCNKCYARRSE